MVRHCVIARCVRKKAVFPLLLHRNPGFLFLFFRKVTGHAEVVYYILSKAKLEIMMYYKNNSRSMKGHSKVNLLIHGYDCNSNDQKSNYIKEIVSSLDEVNEKSLCCRLISLWLQLHVHVHDNFLCTAA